MVILRSWQWELKESELRGIQEMRQLEKELIHRNGQLI